jgi:hypothetical protein
VQRELARRTHGQYGPVAADDKIDADLGGDFWVRFAHRGRCSCIAAHGACALVAVRFAR